MANTKDDVRIALRDRRKELGLTLKEVADKVGVSEATISRWESGDIANMKRNRIVSLAKALEISPRIIMGWDDQPVTYIYEAAAGSGMVCDTPSAYDYYGMRLDEDQVLVKVRGNSMEPTLMDGDQVVIEPTSIPYYPDQIYLVKVNGEEHTLKHVFMNDDGLVLTADNVSVYPPHPYTAQQVQELPVTIEGVVTMLIRQMK